MAEEMLTKIAHRPYDLPRAPWVMRQTWNDLLFAHWPVDAQRLKQMVPAPLELDQYDGAAWIGVVPFAMNHIKARFSPFELNFLELNVRTYVTYKGRHGVLFFSLDASNAIAVEAARTCFHLPYYIAVMQLDKKPNGEIDYTSKRSDKRGLAANLDISYQPVSDPYLSQPGSIEQFLTERYCLFTIDWRGRLVTCNIHHTPWSLQTAEAEIRTNSMFAALPLQIMQPQPLLHFSKSMQMLCWLAESAGGI